MLWFTPAVWPTVYEATQQLKALADEVGQPMTHLALQWVQRQPGVTSVLVGARDAEQAKQNADATRVAVDDEVLHHMTAISEQVAQALPSEAWNIFGMNP